VGDIITMLNQAPVRDPADLYIKTAMLRVGEVVDLDVIRNGQSIAMRATLGATSGDSRRRELPLSRN
jgi:S1-C subfamily serine protease